MGERCACCLYLDREADKETLETIKEHLFIDFHEDWRMFYFEQVNFGDLPDEIAFHLIEKNISFVWLWERSFMWDAGVIIHDAEKRRCASLTRTRTETSLCRPSRPSRSPTSSRMLPNGR